MSNPYLHYYSEQVGSGLAAFQGVRYQRGHGFFGRIFSGIGNFVKELAPSLFKRTLPSAIGLAQDVISGENFGESAKNRLIEAGKGAADETLSHIKTKIQRGSGYRKRKRKRRRKINKSKKIRVNKKKRKRGRKSKYG